VRAVIFDWRGTLVSQLDSRGWARESLQRALLPADDEAITDLWRRINAAAGEPNRLKDPTGNTSYERHRETFYSVFTAAGLPDALSDALWDVDSDPSYNIFADDAAETIAALRAHEVKIGVLSNIHFDIRPEFKEAELLDSVDEFILSGEEGIQKPNPAIFQLALDRLGVSPEEALMVGDNPARDGVANAVGITTILVPPLTDHRRRQLHRVTAAVGV
jgi:HAD superfamily hydrolase (TIGR01493 family)